MTTEREFAGANGHRVRVDVEATDPDEVEREAFEKAVEKDPDIWMGGSYPSEGLPIGWDGGDPHDAVAEGESINAGDHK